MRVTAALAPRCTSVQEEEGSHPRRRYCSASTGARWCQRCPMPGRRRSTTSPHTSPGQARRAAAGAVSTPGAGPHEAGGRGRGALRTLFVWPRNFRGVAACKRVSNTLIAPSAAQFTSPTSLSTLVSTLALVRAQAPAGKPLSAVVLPQAYADKYG